MHSAPAASTSTELVLIPYGTLLNIQCVIPNGQSETGNDTTTIWDYVTYDGESGFVTDAWVFTGINSADAGICPGSPPGITTISPPAPTPGGASVFYTGEGAAGATYASKYASEVMSANGSAGYQSWVGLGNCNSEAAAGYNLVAGGRYVSTLSGFSLGRLGPILLLEEDPIYASHVDYILMFDPGNLSNLSGCDKQINSSQILANWLVSSEANRLVIMAGALTQEDGAEGIQDVYFPDIRGRSIADQVLVCNMDTNKFGWGHNDVVKNYAWMIGQSAPGACPSGFFGWHP
jgi:hypothetical protein